MTLLRRITLMIPLLASALCSSSCAPVCDCRGEIAGLVITTDAPVTSVSLSGTACGGGSFRCIPAAFDSTIHGDCSQVQIAPRAEGHCVVDLIVGDASFRIEREMINYPANGCCGGGIVEANHLGAIDLHSIPDGGRGDGS